MNIERKETETIDRLFLELSQFTKAKTKRDLQLDALIMAVERKFPGETRFETALRYIQEAEAKSSVATAAVTPNPSFQGCDADSSRRVPWNDGFGVLPPFREDRLLRR